MGAAKRRKDLGKYPIQTAKKKVIKTRQKRRKLLDWLMGRYLFQ